MKHEGTLNNIALGLGVAVLGFAVYRYFAQQRAAGGSAAALGPNAGSTWQTLTFPLGTATGGTNTIGGIDQVYTSTSWNPDAISAQIGADTVAAMGAAGQGILNTYGFTVPQ